MITLNIIMTQYPKLLCMLVCLAVLDKALTGSNMGMRILKRDHGQIRRSNPTMNLVNNLKSYLCINLFTFRILFCSPLLLLVMVMQSTDQKMNRQGNKKDFSFSSIRSMAESLKPGILGKMIFLDRNFWFQF